MGKRAIYEELDDALDQLLAEGEANDASGELAEVIVIAGHLAKTPSAEFRAQLRQQLEEAAVFVAAGRTAPGVGRMSSARMLQMPKPMFSSGPATYPVQRQNFLLSMLAHAAMLALVVGSGAWFASHKVEMKRQSIALVDPSEYVLPASPKEAAGGGGGGSRDKLVAPQGALPKQANEQFTPPTMRIYNGPPKLAVEPSVIAPQVQMAMNMPNLGNPMSKIPGPPSDGTGSGSGIGSGTGGGVGSGYGRGIGPGYGGGVGGGVYRVGGGVSAPRALYSPDPDYSEEARKAKYQGTVVLWVVVSPDGRPRDVKVQRSLGMGLDQKAIEAVRNWRFDPARKDGHPVAVQINVEVNFRLY